MSRNREKMVTKEVWVPRQTLEFYSGDPATETFFDHPPFSGSVHHEYMIDEVDRYQRGLPKGQKAHKKEWHPCAHVRVSSLYAEKPPYTAPPPWWDPFGPSYHISWNGLYQAHNFEHGGVAAGMAGTLGSRYGHVSDTYAGHFNRRAFDEMLTQIPTSISIMNFLMELRDVKQILKGAQNFLAKLASGYLWANFAALPLVRDIMALFSLLPNVEKRLRHLQSINFRTVTLSYADLVTVYETSDPPPPYGEIPHNSGSGTASTIAWLESHTCLLRANFQVRTDLQLYGIESLINACAAALGLYNPQKVIWNAIPFSFIVDWLVEIDAWLDTYAHQPFEGTMEVLGVNSSAKAKRFYGVWSPTSPTEWARISTTLVHTYHRFGGIPEGTLQTDGLTPYQQSLAAALALAGGGRSYRTRGRRGH
jgi:hypothetical protein